jgi:hypothetical protein
MEINHASLRQLAPLALFIAFRRLPGPFNAGDGLQPRLRAGCDEAEGKDWTVSADSTVVRAHQHAAGARRARPADLPAGGATE